LKPIITIHPQGSGGEAKKFDGFMEAAFWMGVDHAEGDLGSVKVRQPSQSYDEEVSTLGEFTNLLVRRQINFSIEFFSEPQGVEVPGRGVVVPEEEKQEDSPLVYANGNDYQSEIDQLKEEYKRGAMTKKQYKSKKDDILKQWRDKVEGKLGL
jgi:hypothetical protein